MVGLPHGVSRTRRGLPYTYRTHTAHTLYTHRTLLRMVKTPTMYFETMGRRFAESGPGTLTEYLDVQGVSHDPLSRIEATHALKEHRQSTQHYKSKWRNTWGRDVFCDWIPAPLVPGPKRFQPNHVSNLDSVKKKFQTTLLCL